MIGGDPRTFYEQGINISFQEQGVSGVATYLSGTGKPTGLTGSNYKYGTYNHDLSIGNTSPKWDDYTGNLSKQEEQLQKIITQNIWHYIRTLWKLGPNIAEPVSHI